MMQSSSHRGGTILLATVMATAVGLQAQNSTSRDDQSTITVTGCLQSGGSDRAAVGTSGSANASGSTAADNRSFMLVNARVGSAAGGGSGVTTVAPAGSGTNESAVRAGNTPPSPAIAGAIDKNGNTTATAGMYLLGGNNPELPRHVGQEVEISGRLIPSATTGATGANAAKGSTDSTSASGTANTSAGRTQQLDVRTIRMIASVCAAR